MDFQESKELALSILREYVDLLTNSAQSSGDEEYSQNAQKLIEQIKQQRFTIGVVGVFNCGKSTFLNALLRESVLSTYILPETATITTLRYSENEYAQIKYWKAEEWERIKAQAKDQSNDNENFLESVMKAEQTPGFNRYITAQGFEERIQLSNLKEYTSANTEKQLSALVREVEIGTDFEFCADNVHIVDTPGLNDPVRMREHVTEHEFLPTCDLMLFLLPAGMVFTDFDRRFIQRQLRRGRLHKLVVVVNKIDTLNNPEEDVEAIVTWAKSQIKKAISEVENEQGAASNRKLDNIGFFPLSSYQALLHRTDQADRARWTEKESRFPEFEEYLHHYLFQGDRAREMQSIMRGRIRGLLKGRIATLEDSLAALGETSAELTKRIEDRERQQKVIEDRLERVKEDADRSIEHFEDMFDARVKILEANLKSLPSVIERQAMDKLEAYLAGGLSALPGFKGWIEGEFVPYIQGNIELLSQQELDSAIKDIEKHVARAEDDVVRSYKRLIEDLKLAIPNSDLNYADFAGLLEDLVVGLAAGLATRELLLVLAAELSAFLAGVIAGPVGWLILGAAAIWQLVKGGAQIKDKLRQRVQESLRGKLEELMASLAPNLAANLQKQKQGLLDHLHAQASEPAEELQAQIDRQIEQLEALRKEKEQADFNDKAREEALLAETQTLQDLLTRTEELV